MRKTYEKCIDCGKPKTTASQQRVPRCYKCAKKRVPNRGGHYYTHCIDCGKEKSEPNEYPRCKSCSKKLLWKDKEFKEKQDIAHSDPDFIQRQRDSKIEVWKNEEWRERQHQAYIDAWANPELRARHSETLQGSYSEIYSSDEQRYIDTCAKLMKYGDAMRATPEYREQRRQWMLAYNGVKEGDVINHDYGPEFTKWYKKQIRKRDGFKCQLCGKCQAEEGKALAVHHINYDKLDCREENLITLCGRCHNKTNKNRSYWQTFFTMQKRQHIQDWQRKVVVTSVGWSPICQ